MQRYFITKEQIIGNNIIINDETIHHILNVMRMKEGSEALFCDEERTYLGRMITYNKKEVTFDIIDSYIEDKTLPINVSIAQGMVRKEKMEEVIDTISELGAYAYIGVEMKYSQVSIERMDDKKIERLKKISKEACEQSQRNKLLKIDGFFNFNDFLSYSKGYDLKIFAYEKSGNDNSLINKLKGKYQNILVLIGPEGGFSPEEVTILEENGFQMVTLGKRILRTEVACSHIMSVISNYLEDNYA